MLSRHSSQYLVKLINTPARQGDDLLGEKWGSLSALSDGNVIELPGVRKLKVKTSSGCTDVTVLKAHLIISQRHLIMLRVYIDRNTKNTSISLWCAQSLQSCPTLCDPMDCSPPGPSVHGTSQVRILEWVAISPSKGSSRPRDQICISYISCTGRRVFYHWCHLGSPSLYQGESQKVKRHLEVLVLSSKRATMLSLSKDSLSSFYVPSTILDVRDGMLLINVQGIFHQTIMLLGFPSGSAAKYPPAMQDT